MSHWPLKRAPFWAQAPFFHVLLPLIAAIVCYDHGWLPPSPLWGVFAYVLALALLVLYIARPGSKLLRALFLPVLYGWVLSFGMLQAQRYDITQQQDWFGHSLDSSGASLVKILDAPAEKARIWRMRVAVVKSSRRKDIEHTSGQAYLNIYKPAPAFALHKGDLILVPSRWQLITNSGNPFEVDYRAMHRRRNIYHQQFLALTDVRVYQRAALSRSVLDRAHTYCAAQLRRYVPDGATYGLLQAMLLGDESAFDPELRHAYSETGVIHIVSISGSHVGILFGAVVLLLSRIRGRKGTWIRLLAGLGVIWFYVLMAGAPPSAIRAALMFSVIGLGTTFSRGAQPVNTLFAAAVALLAVNPAWLFAVGFQLSFSAVLSILLFYQPIYDCWPQRNPVLRWLWRGAAGSLAAEVLTAPLVIYYFHNFPLAFLPANLLAAILVGLFALLGGMAIILASPLAPLASTIACCVTLLVRLFNTMILVLQRWSPVSFRYLQVDGLELLLIYLSIAGVTFYLLRKAAYGLWLGLPAMMVLLLLLCHDRLTRMQQDRLVVYQVSRQDVADRIRGIFYYPLIEDTATSSAFAQRQAHTGWGAWRRGSTTPGSCCLIGGKRVLVLRQHPALQDTAVFPVDILVIHYPLKDVVLPQLQQVFRPGRIIAGGAQARWVVRQWKEQCRQAHQPFHAASTDGAFVLE
jgi:competence protein ComEC